MKTVVSEKKPCGRARACSSARARMRSDGALDVLAAAVDAPSAMSAVIAVATAPSPSTRRSMRRMYVRFGSCGSRYAIGHVGDRASPAAVRAARLRRDRRRDTAHAPRQRAHLPGVVANRPHGARREPRRRAGGADPRARNAVALRGGRRRVRRARRPLHLRPATSASGRSTGRSRRVASQGSTRGSTSS